MANLPRAATAALVASLALLGAGATTVAAHAAPASPTQQKVALDDDHGLGGNYGVVGDVHQGGGDGGHGGH